MPILMQVTADQESFNAAVRDGTAGQKMGRIVEEQKPESVYFTEIEAQRTAIMVVDIEDSSQIPSLAEPWFLTFNAKVRLHPVMNSEDFGKAGLDELGKKWG